MWFINMKSRVKGDLHARFREKAQEKFPRLTRFVKFDLEDFKFSIKC